MLKRIIVCDACKTERPYGEADGWLHVQSYAATPETFARMVEGVDANDASITPYGDLCSLTCLANWSSMLQNMRELADDPGLD